MPAPHSFVKHARTFALLTLVSRVLGLVRDAVIIRLLGISGLGTAFWNAFQVPNTFRRLFGEGALSAAFIPQYAQLVKHDPSLSHRFASLTLALLAGGLALLTLVLEALLALVLWLVPVPPEGRLSLLCLAFMLPFMPLICVTAALGGMLQTHGRFAAQAGAPIILNLMMIVAALGLAYGLGWSASATALGVAASVSLAGLLQVAWCLRDLRGLVTWTTLFEGAGPRCRQMFGKMVPVVIGLSAVQIGVLIEAQVLLNWPLYVGDTILGTPYPLDASAGAALTAAQRLYQFPLGIFGIALATAVFPLLARQADEPAAFAATLRQGIRLALFIGAPATLGLVWVAPDLTATLFLGGAVGPDDARRMAGALVLYAPLVGTYSLTHVLTRALFALGDTRTSARLSMLTVALGLLMGIPLMWVLRERGLALAGSIAAAFQVIALTLASQRRIRAGDSGIFDSPTLRALGRMALACSGMLAALLAVRLAWPPAAEPSHLQHAVRLGINTLVGGVAYLLLATRLCRQEIAWLRSKPAVRR